MAARFTMYHHVWPCPPACLAYVRVVMARALMAVTDVLHTRTVDIPISSVLLRDTGITPPASALARALLIS